MGFPLLRIAVVSSRRRKGCNRASRRDIAVGAKDFTAFTSKNHCVRSLRPDGILRGGICPCRGMLRLNVKRAFFFACCRDDSCLQSK